ncbi:MAG TPA: PQQ-dependent sugar dehydrogenase, partial [Nitrososphaeraceae archaeon]|nr:PQQ-dependent sugar dehydrogenase [Nitrososphaeraceae archaeon]
ASAQQKIPGVVASIGKGEPTIKDLNLKVETVATGLALPTTMAFIGPNDILVLEKNKGTVQRIVNGQMLAEPLLRVNVSSEVERGMLGIATSQDNQTGKSKVFLYYTESEGGEPVASRLYRYELTNEKLVNPVLLLDLPAVPGPRHNAGNIMIGPDNNLYVSVGDLDGHITLAQNVKGASGLDGSSAILRITQDGKAVGQGMLGESGISKKYYAYGLRNSFGMDFDPVTGKLWDTENGASYGDEINFIEPGFNSGWLQVQGMAPDNFNIEDLENFQGKGNYSDPEFVWTDTVGPTAIKFFGSDRLGNQYKNDIFVSDITQGNIYHFDLIGNRTNLILDGLLADKMSNNSTENQDIIFGEGFGGISDLEVGPYDGYLYVVSLGHGNIYRIVSN